MNWPAEATRAVDAPQSSEQVAERLSMSVEWARLHVGDHKCLDGRRYVVSCLVTDRTCDRVARSYMRINEEARNA